MQCKAIQMASPSTWSSPAWAQPSQPPVGSLRLSCDLKALLPASVLAGSAWAGDAGELWRYYSDADFASATTTRCCSDSVSSDEGGSGYDLALSGAGCDDNNNDTSSANLNVTPDAPSAAFQPPEEGKGDANNNTIALDASWTECKPKNSSPRHRLVDEQGFIRRAACLCVDETESKNSSVADVYTEHSIQVNVAQYAPSGFYVCSGDQHGKVRVWDTINPEHILKAEYQPLGGPIRDLCWSHDSQRICVVGEGRGKFAHVFMMDTGASVKGDLSGHTKAINSVSWKPTRPFRIATGSEDNKSAFYEGPPFVFKCTKADHTKFVQSVRYSPDGEKYATGGFDGKIFVYNGKDAELIKEMGSPAHKGGVYAVSWSPDSKQLLSASGDKTCKIWDAETGEMVSEFVMGTEVEDQQVSCIWTGDFVVSVSLSGFINYLNPADPSKPKKIIKGHNKPISRIGLSPDRSTLYTAGVDGTVTVWDVATGDNERISGKGHGNHVSGVVVKDDIVFSAGIDDSVKIIDRLENGYTGTSISLGSQPKMIAALDDGVICVTTKEICMIRDNVKVGSFPISWDGLSISTNGSFSNEVAVGGQDNLIHIYTLDGNTLTEKTTLQHLGPVTDVAYSPDGQYLVACDANRKVIVYSLPGYEKFNRMEWGFHNARINCVAWSPDSSMVASGSLDTMIIIWSMTQTNKHIIIKNSHPQSQVTGLVWLDNERVMSSGHDGLVKTWSVKF